VKKTLVVRLDHLGDVVLTTPLIRALALGGHTVDVLVKQAFEPVLTHSPYIRECFSQEAIAPGFPKAWWKLGAWMREGGYNNILVPYARERRLCFASMISGADTRIAMWGGIWGRLTFHQCLRSEIPRPFSEILLRCATALEIPGQGLTPDLFLTDTERAELRARIPPAFRGRNLIGLHPGTAGNTCNLPGSVYAEVVQLLLDGTDCAVAVTGTEDEGSLIRDWPARVISSERVWVCLGQLTLRQLACAIAEMDVYICPSTGPLHIASAVGTPTVSPFCPVAPLCASIWGNVGSPARILEPTTCPRIRGEPCCCDFQGQITANQIVDQVIDILKSRVAKVPTAQIPQLP